MRNNRNLLWILTVFFFCQFAWSQMKTVSGKVTDVQGAPIPGVNVLVQGTSKGTATDFEGNYSIET